MDAETVLEFWFAEAHRPLWFRSTAKFDTQVRERFEPVWRQARLSGLQEWEASSRGALALVIVLDQFPLNMYRGESASFATEAQAREVSRRAIARGYDQTLSEIEKMFLYLPFMHSESVADQDYSVELFGRAGMTDSLRWARHHRDLVIRFGRFPHRNEILGRESSAEELAYLASAEAFMG